MNEERVHTLIGLIAVIVIAGLLFGLGYVAAKHRSFDTDAVAWYGAIVSTLAFIFALASRRDR